jgi:hypothetical protein
MSEHSVETLIYVKAFCGNSHQCESSVDTQTFLRPFVGTLTNVRAFVGTLTYVTAFLKGTHTYVTAIFLDGYHLCENHYKESNLCEHLSENLL